MTQINSSSIIGKPIRVGNLLVAQFDFPKNMNWDDAKKGCETLGNGWRLPTKDELNILYQKKEKIGGFKVTFYWSSTEVASNVAWLQGFGSGVQHGNVKSEELFVRAVRAF